MGRALAFAAVLAGLAAGACFVLGAAVAGVGLAAALFSADFGDASFLSLAVDFGAVFGVAFVPGFGTASSVVFGAAFAFLAAGGAGCTSTTPVLETFTLTLTLTLVEFEIVSALRLVPFAGAFEAVLS